MFFGKRQAQSCQNQNSITWLYDESRLESMLDRSIQFIHAFRSVLPREWYYFDLYVDVKRTSYGPSLFVETGLLVFKFTLGNWWEGLLWQFPDIEDFMLWSFTFDPQERTFTASIQTGVCENRIFPNSVVVGMLQQSLNSYEAKHPEVRFQRKNWGARIRNV